MHVVEDHPAAWPLRDMDSECDVSRNNALKLG
jgi:hypothetical protein